VTVEFAKDSKAFAIKGGFMGEEVFDVSGIEALSKLPSREAFRWLLSVCCRKHLKWLNVLCHRVQRFLALSQ